MLVRGSAEAITAPCIPPPRLSIRDAFDCRIINESPSGNGRSKRSGAAMGMGGRDCRARAFDATVFPMNEASCLEASLLFPPAPPRTARAVRSRADPVAPQSAILTRSKEGPCNKYAVVQHPHRVMGVMVVGVTPLSSRRLRFCPSRAFGD